MLTGILVILGLILLPFILLLLLLSLTLSLWCWKRIGPYFVNFARWTADWRNLVPGLCLILLGYVVVWAATALPRPFPTLGLVLLIILVPVTLVGGAFALLAIVARGLQWFWVIYRRQFWQAADAVTEVAWRRRPAAAARRPRRAVPMATSTPASGTTPAPPAGLAPATRTTPRKRSPLATFWAILLGQPPQQKRRPPRPTAVPTTEQTIDNPPGETAPPATGAGIPRAASRGAGVDTATEEAGKDDQRPPARASKPATGAARSVTAVPRAIRGGAAWMARKVGAGILWIRIRLNLD